MTDPTESGAMERPWLCGESPEKWFQTLKPPLCCQSCEQKALAHARELYEEKCNAYDDHVRIIKGLVEVMEQVAGLDCTVAAWKGDPCGVCIYCLAREALALVPEELKK